MGQIQFGLIVGRDERRGDDGGGHDDEEGAGDHPERAAQVLAQEAEARRAVSAAARLEFEGVRRGGYGQRTFGLRIVAAMSMTTLTTTTMIVK